MTRLAPPNVSHPHPLRAAPPGEVYSWCQGRFCCDMCKAWRVEPVLYHCDECGTYDACAACVESGQASGMLSVAQGEPVPYQSEDLHLPEEEEESDFGDEDEGEEDEAGDEGP